MKGGIKGKRGWGLVGKAAFCPKGQFGLEVLRGEKGRG